MSMFQFASVALHTSKLVDCRRLILSCDFSLLTEEEIICLSNELMSWAYQLVGDAFVFDWLCNGRNVSTRNLPKKLPIAISREAGLGLGFDSYVNSPVVRNVSTLRQFQKSIQYGMVRNSLTVNANWSATTSYDYPEYFSILFPSGRPQNEVLIDRVYSIFCEPNKTCLNYPFRPDFTGHFSATPHRNFSDAFYGRAKLSLSAFALGDMINSYAEEFARFAIELSDKYKKINLHVALQPDFMYKNAYMRYFGNHLIHDGSHEEVGCLEKEWYSTYYLCGVEWMNILSPLAKQHIKPIDQDYRRNNIVVSNLTGGGLLVKSESPILNYTFQDAHAMKSVIVPALYPGGTSVSLKGLFPGPNDWRVHDWCPRNNWAIVPIEKKEIDVVATYLVYRSASSML